MKVLDGYAIETDKGMAYIRPHESLFKNALALVPRSRWTTCPECGEPSPLFYGDPESSYWCFHCQISRQYPLFEDRRLHKGDC